MLPVHHVDAILLLSLTVAAKRRPADLIEIISAIALAQDELPGKAKLAEAFARLSASGLIVEIDRCYTLTAHGQAMMADQRAKDDTVRKLSRIKERLADYLPQGEHPTVVVGHDQLLAAIQGYQALRSSSGRNLLAAKPAPKPVWIPTKELVQGKQHLPARRKPRSP